MQLYSPTTGFYARVVLLLTLHSILVAADSLVAAEILAVENIPVAADTLAMMEILVAVDILVVVEEFPAVVYSLVEEGNLVVAHTPGVDILEVAFATQPCRIVVAHVDQD